MEGAEVEKGEKAECVDGYRIPSSVFSRKSGKEWSGASGDSLFSIHMGSSSFSNDDKAAELTISLPPVMEQEEGSLHSRDSSSRPPEKHATPFTPSFSPTLNSQVSNASNTSFAFPVLVSASGKGESARMMGTGEAQPRQQPRKPPNKWFSCCSCAWPRSSS